MVNHQTGFWVNTAGGACLPHPQSAPVIFGGDLNTGRLSPVYRGLLRSLLDVLKVPPNPGPAKASFPSRRPLLHLDHISVSRHFRILNVKVPRTHATHLASDHLPIYADLELMPPTG